MRFWGRDHISLIADNGKLYDYPRDQDHLESEVTRSKYSCNGNNCTDFQQNYFMANSKAIN